MTRQTVTEKQLAAFARHLTDTEHSAATKEKYLRDARAFAAWLGGRRLTRETAAAWKERLAALGRAPAGINAALSALNALFSFLGREDCRLRFLKVQRRVFREPERELTQCEYQRLVRCARSHGKERLALVLEAICATGIRVSELRFLTVGAARRGEAEISLKGKVRTIVLPVTLCKRLLAYARAKKIASGEIFLTEGGKSLSRCRIWAEMKALCPAARVDPRKVFPHNLRHLFATVFYKMYRDVVRLADLLGHSSVDTTRIYLRTSGSEQRRQLERLRLIL